MVRCMFCGKEGFKNLDESSYHLWGLTSNGKPVCPSMEIEFLVKVDKGDKWFG